MCPLSTPLKNKIVIKKRIYLLYFDHKFAQATFDRTWRSSINPSESNFFLNHRHTFGRFKYLFGIVIFFNLLLLIIFVLITIFVDKQIVYTVIYIISRIIIGIPIMIFICIIMVKVEKHNDKIFLRKELKVISIIVFIQIVFGVCNEILQILTSNTSYYIVKHIVFTGNIIFTFVSTYIQTGWVAHKALKPILKRRRSTKQLTMTDILRQQQSFEVFMRHCMSEFSYENLVKQFIFFVFLYFN